MNKKQSIAVICSLILSFIFFSGISHAYTEVGGRISSDTTWTLGGSPYIVTGSIRVNEGVTLTIQPGVTIKFDGNTTLLIEGNLVARGTSDSMITFTGNSDFPVPGHWVYIKFSESSKNAFFDPIGNYSDGCVLEYCVVEYGGGATTGGAVWADKASPFINHCEVTDSARHGIAFYNGNDTSGNNYNPNLEISKITNNTIKNNNSWGLISQGNKIIIDNNEIKDNGKVGLSASAGNHTITNNTVTGNEEGIFFEGGGTATAIISYNIIKDNVGSTTGRIVEAGGITVNSPATIIGNVITGNRAEKGGGIYMPLHAACSTVIRYNLIDNNLADFRGGAIYGCGTIENNCLSNNRVNTENNENGANTLYITGNSTINYNNILPSIEGYALYYELTYISPDLDATNNYWGTDDESEIESMIYDWFVDQERGVVNFSPFLYEPVSCDPTDTTTIPSSTTTTGGQITTTTTTTGGQITTTTTISTPGGITVKLDPEIISLPAPGETFDIDVLIEDVQDLGGFEFEIDYDPNIVTVEMENDVVLGDFLGSTGRTATPVGTKIDNIDGSVKFGAMSFGSASGASGNGVLASITFTVQNRDDSTLDLNSVKATDSTANELAFYSVDDAVLSTGTITTTTTIPDPSAVSIQLIPHLGIRSHLLPIPFIMFVVGKNTDFNETTTVDFSGDTDALYSPWSPIIVSSNLIVVVSICTSADFGERDKSYVTVTVTTDEEIQTAELTLTPLLFF